jgi:hypothetical protein
MSSGPSWSPEAFPTAASDPSASSPARPPLGSRPDHDAERASKRQRDAEPAADAGLNKASLAHLLC